MVKLILLDGSIELNEEQRQALLKTPYFEALFLRWSEGEQTEYQVELTINTVKFLLGEISQLNVLTQAAKQAVQEARQELDMVGAQISQVDLESPIYPINLHPLLEPYTIKKNISLSTMPNIPSVEMYQLMFEWNPPMSSLHELNRLVDQVSPDVFSSYLRLFWNHYQADFLSQAFSSNVEQQIVQHPEIFREYPASLQEELIERLMNLPSNSSLYSFYQTTLNLEMKEWIKQALGNCPRHSILMKIVRHDPSYLFQCLKISSESNCHSWNQFQQLLEPFTGTKEYPLREDQIKQLNQLAQQNLRQWAEGQIFICLGAKTYEPRFMEEFASLGFGYCERLIFVFPDHSFPVHINQGRKLTQVMNWVKAGFHLLITVENDIYSSISYSMDELNFLLPYTPTPQFGTDKNRYSEEELTWLCQHRIYVHPNNVFLGSPEIAERMFKLTLEAGGEPGSAYLLYFIDQKKWELLPQLESLYKKHPARLSVLQVILLSCNPDIEKIFLTWEISLR